MKTSSYLDNFKHYCKSASMTFGMVMLLGVTVAAQCPISEFTSGLRAPSKIITTSMGNLIVAEGGAGANTGRISIVDPVTGARRTLLDGLPSGFAPPNGDPSGPSGLALRGRTLYVSIGQGDATLNGDVQGTEVANPNPTSPLFNSVLAIHFSANVERRTEGLTLSYSDQLALKAGNTVRSGRGSRRLSIELIADFPDFVAEPRPNAPNNVRPTNAYGLALDVGELYVVNAGLNLIRKVDVRSGEFETFITFNSLPNPLPFGPPFVEAVPDNVRIFAGILFVPLLTGFPFAPGIAQVRRVKIETGQAETLISGLTSAIDALPVRIRRNVTQYLTLEFSTNFLARAPGRLQLFDTPQSAPTVIADCLTTPTSMTLDDRTGDVFVTEIATGRIVRVQIP